MENLRGYISKYKFDILFVIVVVTIAIVLTSNFSLLHIQGSSMAPTYNHKETVILKKTSELKNDDVAVFMAPFGWSGDDKKFIKRIIASEGDTLSIEGDSMKVNGEEVANIEKKMCSLDEFEVTIEGDNYFMVGDNYSSSNDSLTQLCNGNKNYLVEVEDVLFSGKEIYVIGGF